MDGKRQHKKKREGGKEMRESHKKGEKKVRDGKETCKFSVTVATDTSCETTKQ
jgi:hypothetical protein